MNPTSAPAGSILDSAARAIFRRLADGGGAALVAAFDHVLAQNDWARARLAPFAGRQLLIGIDMRPLPGLPPPQLRVRIVEGGLLERLRPVNTAADGASSVDRSSAADDSPAAEAPPSVRVLLQPSTDAGFALLRRGPRGLSQFLKIDGDAMLAAALADVAEHARWDLEEDASRVLGDALAHRLGRGASALRDSASDLRRRAESATAGALTGEQSPLLGRDRLDAMRGALDVIEARLSVLEARQRSPRQRGA
ncbi:MAG: hypothetical protein AB7L76_03105 [Burkholderiaceae bacterium]